MGADPSLIREGWGREAKQYTQTVQCNPYMITQSFEVALPSMWEVRGTPMLGSSDPDKHYTKSSKPRSHLLLRENGEESKEGTLTHGAV